VRGGMASRGRAGEDRRETDCRVGRNALSGEARAWAGVGRVMVSDGEVGRRWDALTSNAKAG